MWNNFFDFAGNYGEKEMAGIFVVVRNDYYGSGADLGKLSKI